MGNLLRQSLQHEKIQIWKLALMVVGTVGAMYCIMYLSMGFGPVLASLFAVFALLIGSCFCFRFVYRHLSKFDYKLIDKELILERSLGQANHVVYTIDAEHLKKIVPYEQFQEKKKISRLGYLVVGKDTSHWYVIVYSKEEKDCHLVIEPNEAFLKGIEQISGQVG